MPTRTFVEALTELKRKSKLMGRAPSTREISAVSEGYFADAATRLAQQKQLELQERGLTQTKELAEKELGLYRERFEAEKEAAAAATARSQRQMIGMGVGAGIGFAVGGPPGALIGGTIGAAVGGCIIVSTCTSRYSYETNITRQVRDQYLGPITLSGYYTLGNLIVPWIKKSPLIKKIIKKYLVDRLIDYGECLLKYKQKPKYFTSKVVTETFLGLCYAIGKSIQLKNQKEMA